METLNFEHYPMSIKNKENKRYIFDVIRKKDLLLTPEEWVRQHCIQFLLQEKKYPVSLINVEKSIQVYGQMKRYDIIVFTPKGKVKILVECKAPHIPLDQTVFDQIARYNLQVDSEFLMVTNGLQHIYCQLDYHQKTYHFLRELPAYSIES
jgi:hypothetical protein